VFPVITFTFAGEICVHKSRFSRKGAKAQRKPWKRGSALRLCAFAGAIKAMRALLTVIFVILFHATVGAQQQPSTSGDQDCAGPTTEVLVTVQQDPINERGYLISIKNNSKDSILALSVGDGVKPELYATGFAVPLQIIGPPGWTARHVFKEESIFMRWVWTTSNPENMIAANKSASNFKIVLPPFPANAEKNRYPDGNAVRPVVVSELPFRVQFASGQCVWGQIQSARQ
jgi:hypothetical protein